MSDLKSIDEFAEMDEEKWMKMKDVFTGDGEPELADVTPNSRVVLDSLTVTHESVHAAMAMARAWSKKKLNGNHGASMVLSGPVGTGKTHIAKACLWSMFHEVDGQPIAPLGAFWNANDIIQALSAVEFEGEVMKQAITTTISSTCPMVVIDDVGAEQNLPYIKADRQAREIQERYYRIINYCYRPIPYDETWQISLILTTNLALDDLEKHIGPRAWSRLQEMAPAGFMIDMDGVPDYRKFLSGREELEY